MARPVTLFTIQWGDLSLEEICALADWYLPSFDAAEPPAAAD